MSPFSAAFAILLMACAAAAEVQRIAVFVGEDRGLEDERPLRYAARDAKEMAEAFRRAGTFDEDRVYLLVNPSLEKIKASLQEVKGRVRELRKAGTETLVLLYYSGHGSAEGLHVQGKVLYKEELSQYLESLESNLKILILDACESGDFLRSKGGHLVEGPKVVKVDRLESQGTILISSSSRGEMAQESEDYRGAVFTHHFLNGLRGLADYDGDKSIRLMEAFDYARVSTKREEIQGRVSQQNPGFDFDMAGESDPVVARIGTQQSQLLMRHMPPGPLEIYNGNSMQLECRVWLTGQDSLSFSLPSSKYVLAYREKSGSRIAEADLTWQRTAMISPEGFRRKSKSMLNEKGGRILDMHYSGIQFASRKAPMFRDNRSRLRDVWLNQVEYVFRGYWSKQTLGLSYSRTTLDWGVARYNFVGDSARVMNRIQMAGAGYSLEVPLLRGMRGQVLIGAQASFHRTFQEVRSPPFEDKPVVPGDGTTELKRDLQSNLYRLAVPLECELYLPHRFWISLSAGAGFYFYDYQTRKDSGTRGVFEPALSVGHQF